MITKQKHLLEDLRRLDIEFQVQGSDDVLAQIKVQPTLIEIIKAAQSNDPQLQRIREEVGQGTRPDFVIKDDTVRYGNRVCVPNDLEIKRQIMEEAHCSRYTIHPGSTKMYRDLRNTFWWNNMKREIASFVSQCLTCQQVKAEHQKPAGLLEPLPIPEWKWDNIAMDFIVGLPKSRKGNDAIWVIVDRLSKSAHFLPYKMTHTLEKMTSLYMDEIVRLHGVPISIVSDRDPRFVSRFWKSLHKTLGTKLHFTSAYHPESDGQSERTNQILEDMLRACVLDLKGSWEEHLPLAEFAYNNSYQSSIQMAPFEALYGRRCRSPICWEEVGERKLLGPEIVQQTTEKIRIIRERLVAAQSRQKSYADRRRRMLEFDEGDKVFLKVSPWKGIMRFGKKGKLSPRYVGPFEILDRIGHVAYRIALPPELSNAHNVFHVSMMRKYVPDPSHILEYAPLQIRDDLSYVEYPIRIIDQKEHILRRKAISLVKVLWRNHSVKEATWESEEEMKAKYPHLFDEQGMCSLL